MLAFQQNSKWVIWTGQPINAIRYPLNIENLWSDSELEAIGLHRLVVPAVPAGKVVVSQSIKKVNGVVKYVYVLEDEAPPPEPSTDPADYPLSARQLRLGLVRHSISLSAIEAAIASIPDQLEREEAMVWWEYSVSIEWNHPMTQALMALVGIDTETAADMWMVAKDYYA